LILLENNGNPLYYFCGRDGVKFRINCTKKFCDFLSPLIRSAKENTKPLTTKSCITFIENNKKWDYVDELVTRNILELSEDLPLMEYYYRKIYCKYENPQ